MNHIYNTFSIDSNYSKLQATIRFLKLSRSISIENYDQLLEHYLILIDKQVRAVYFRLNTQKRFRNISELTDFMNNEKTYAKMKDLINDKLGDVNRTKPISVVLYLNFKAIF